MLIRGFIIILLAILLDIREKPVSYVSPLDIPLALSANFGELRPGHFHSGVDFKTKGTTGHNVYSVDEGWIYRISVSPSGFGNALYIRHPGGYSTVYGHLENFIEEIEQYVKENQYRRENFAVELFPNKELFPVEKGQLVASSGNSGSSAGPHLHFEVRKSSNEHPIDPLQFFDVTDDIKPRIDKLVVYSFKPTGNNLKITGKSLYSLTIQNNIYRIKDNRIIRTPGPIGLGIITWDFINSSWNKCGIMSVDIKVDGKQFYNYVIDEFSFSETRYINSFIDYDERIRNGRYIQRTFIEPNNKLTIYNWAINRGIIDFEDSDLHTIEIAASDFNSNISELRFQVQFTGKSISDDRDLEGSIRMAYDTINNFENQAIRIGFPEDCFYNDLDFTYTSELSDSSLFAVMHHIHNKYVPVHNSFEISLKAKPGSQKYADKLGLVYIDKGRVSFAGGEYYQGFVTGRVRELGIYSIGIDTIPPEIKFLNFRENDKLDGRKSLLIRIDDDFSGIKEYRALIDGKWALFSWDPRYNSIRYDFDQDYISRESEHELELTVTDNRNNTTKKNATFFW